MTPCLRATSNDVARVSGAEADVDRLSHQLDKREREQHTSKKNDEDSDNDEWDEFDEDEEYDEDVEIFNFETGWNLVGMDDEWDEEDELDVGERQERFLAGVQIPQKLQKQLLREKVKAAKEAASPDKKPTVAKRGTHSKLRIINGKFANRKLLSPDDAGTRPMMEKVRGAVFSIVQSYIGTGGWLPEGSRWLDLYSGTGAVGLEGLSRGAAEAHFCELDPWVVNNSLGKNLEMCGVAYNSTVHTMAVEALLQRSIESGANAFGGQFDFISVTPPYVLVSYPELMGLLDKCPLIKETTIVIVEYARREAKDIPDTLGPLVKIRDRKYGRTYVAMYGPLSGFSD